ncbi:MAG TPA: hypothetical protein VJ183_08435 [Chloroflexia bacterium]|nr:hypothetical protein [Chloroflexia bacterium]
MDDVREFASSSADDESSRITHHASRFAWARTHSAALVSLLVIAVLYVAALVAVPPEGLTHHDTGAKYLQVRNLRLTPSGLDWSINYPARPLDPELQFVPFNPKQHEVDAQGRIYLQWPIFLGLLTRIPWKVLGFWGLYLVPLLAGLGTLWASYLLAGAVGVPRRVAWLAIPLVGLATPIPIYSLLFFEHTLAAMLVTLSLLAAVIAVRVGWGEGGSAGDGSSEGGSRTAPTRNGRYLMISAALLAFAVYFRSELYVLAFVMFGVYMLDALRRRVWRPLGMWVGAFLLALVPLWAFYAITEGNILPLHATWYFAGGDGASASDTGGIELPRLRYITEAGLGIIPDFLFGPQDAQKAPLSPGFPLWEVVSGLLGVALCAASAAGRFIAEKAEGRGQRAEGRGALYALAAGLGLLLLPTTFTLFSAQPYYNLHGFLLASPFFALALIPSWKAEGSRQKAGDVYIDVDVMENVTGTSINPKSEIRNPKSSQSVLYTLTLVYIGLHALIISALSGLGPISRHEWGQRYLLPAYPALAVLSLLAGWRVWSEYAPRLRSMAVACVVIGGLLAGVGAGFTIRGYVMLADERTQVMAWQSLARTLPAREPLLTDTWWLPLNLAADFYTRPIMLAEGNERMAHWAAQMRAREVTAFGLMSPDPDIFSGTWARGANVIPDGPPHESRGMWLQRYVFNK